MLLESRKSFEIIASVGRALKAFWMLRIGAKLHDSFQGVLVNIFMNSFSSSCKKLTKKSSGYLIRF